MENHRDGANGIRQVTAQRSARLQALGPGVLYAATAVGTSHLVQSTRAGASYGLALLLIILLTYIAKYPAFRFGAQYASATGRSLLHGYRQQGNWAVIAYVIIALGTMFAALPAVTLVTAGLTKAAFDLPLGTFPISVGILLLCATVLIVGGYPTLDRIVKVLMATLAVATLLATVLVIPQIDWSTSAALLPAEIAAADVFFIVALLGFMPSSVDLSVWHSLWSVAKARDSKQRATLRDSLDDFHIGYFGTFLLALCFVFLGTGVMHNSGVEFADSPAGFATQLINLYQQTLGDWSGPLIGAIAVAVMFSTVLTGLDGYPRAAVSIFRLYRGRAEDDDERAAIVDKRAYAIAVCVLSVGSLFILNFLVSSLKVVVDVAATIMFLFAPVVAWLNHRAMKISLVRDEVRPARGLFVLSIAGIIWLAGFSAYFLYLRFLS
jgi:Mn2+/Fe2+ NRAMP family transporter